MCGIFGFWTQAPTPGFDETLLRSGTDAVAHRGPDGSGLRTWLHAPEQEQRPEAPVRVGLGHRRLRIIDLSDNGAQPMCRAGTWVTYNGEIYNFRELRAALEAQGQRFHTASDTEVLLSAFDVWGLRCFERFNGMWALAIWDQANERLILSRDRMGVKPLYYSSRSAWLAFSSEIEGLLHVPGVSREVVPARVARYLVDRRIDDTEETIYRDIRELRGGTALVLDARAASIDVRRYWSLPTEPELQLGDDEALDQFSELFEDAVRLRLHADVPVAITLSGGVDSSAVCVAASRAVGRGVRTFTSRFHGMERIDESEYALRVAASAKADAHLVEPALDHVISEEPLLTAHQALPFMSLSLYVHWRILATIREQQVPVVLSGQGGDENFFGYDRFHLTAVRNAMPHPVRASKAVLDGARHSGMGLGRMIQMLGYFSLPQMQRWRRRGRLEGQVRPAWLVASEPTQPDVVSSVRGQHALELTGTSLPMLLRYDDRTAGALGMETRLPFLDYRLVEFAYRLPLRHRIRDGWTKFIVRRYLQRHGLPDIAWRRNKVGFEVPQGDWTRGLVAARGEQLVQTAFARQFLRDGSRASAAAALSWDVYNVLHVARALSWQAQEAA